MLDLSRITSLGEAFRDCMVTYKTNTALLEIDRHRETGQWSYRELCADAGRFGALLQSHGFAGGDRCAILMSNQARWLISAVGAFWTGAVLVPLDYKLTVPEQLSLIAHCKPRVLVTEYHVWKSMQKEQSLGAIGASLVIVTEAPRRAELHGALRWETSADTELRHVPRTREDVACIVYSSGTGGTPKGCMLSHENYLSQARTLGRLFPMEEDDRYFSILPTNHAIDFMCGMIVPLLFGAAVVHQRTLRAEFLATTMKRYHVTHTAMVPRILKALEEKIREQIDELSTTRRALFDSLMRINDAATFKRADQRISSLLLKPIHDRFGGKLRLIFAGGAFVDPELADFFYRLGFPVVIGYGLTEACTVLTVNDLKPFRANTVGRPIPGVELELRNQNGDGVGQVYARGATIMQGYLDAEEITAETLVDGWLNTGDLGFMDASGHLRLVGRAKNMIVTEGGKNIYPEDIEAAFDRVSCEELCVFAENFIWAKQSLSDERLTVVLRRKKGQKKQVLLDNIRSHNERLADFKRVKSYVLWDDEFPRTASMKLKRDVLASEIRAALGAAEALS